MKNERAEQIAAEALVWMAGQEGLIEAFAGTSGMDLGDIRAQASDPGFLGAVLDFLLMNDEWVKGYCEAHTLPFDTPMRARAYLPGGDLPHWT